MIAHLVIRWLILIDITGWGYVELAQSIVIKVSERLINVGI